MKLIIIEGTLVQDGSHRGRGDSYETGLPKEKRKEDREAYTLISTGRALVADSEEGIRFAREFAAEQSVKEEQAKPAGKR